MIDRPKCRGEPITPLVEAAPASRTRSPSGRELTRGSQGAPVRLAGRAERREAPFDGEALTGGHVIESELNDGHRAEDDCKETHRETSVVLRL